MPAYPPDYSAGDIVGRNFLVAPQPPASSAWPSTKYTTMVSVVGADPDAPAATARATGLNKFLTSWTPFTYTEGTEVADTTPGERFDVTLWHRNTDALRVYLYGYGGELLIPAVYGEGNYDKAPYVEIPPRPEWGWTTVELEVPEIWARAEWQNDYSDPGYIDGVTVGVKAVSTATIASGWLSRIRLDRADSLETGYFYGLTPDTETRDYGYLNDAQTAGAKAVALDSTAPAVPDSAPTITDPGPQTVKVGEPYALQLEGTDTDPSWLPLTYTATGLPAGLECSPAGNITGTPTADAAGGTATVTAESTAPATATLEVAYAVTPADPEPDPEPEPDPDFDQLAEQLAGRVAAFVGYPDDEPTTAQARAAIPIVAEFVRGYTRAHGWTADTPAGPLRAVIVTASSRLVTNPEQVTYYAVADYAERPAVLEGYTVAELGVLHRYRRVRA